MTALTSIQSIADLNGAITNLQAKIKDRAAQARVDRQIPAPTIDTMRAAGLYRVYNPRRFGGFELSMHAVLPLVARVAEACPASAWVLAIYQIHNWVIALMTERAQSEVFATNPDPIVCASLNPSKNSALKTRDGYFIERGRFTFCSGAAAREWALLGILVKNSAGEVVDAGCCLVPGNVLSEIDDWQVSGLRATGSISLVADNLEVPAHRFLSYGDATAYRTPGAKINPGALYRAAFVPMLVLNLAGPALGAARFALAWFVDNLRSKGAAGTYPLPGVAKVDAAAAHAVIATAEMQIASAELLLDHAGETIRVAAEAGESLTPAASAKINLETSYAVRECLHAVQALFLQAGGGVLQPDHPLQTAYQDILAINCHGFLGHEANLALYGSLLTGHAHPQAFL
ncbi:MAG: hypothetical protein HYX63_08220 [Gammaproteobacteria bacterium]|nr:hypothetical protein [Gammaproteobacteria bacterium]